MSMYNVFGFNTLEAIVGLLTLLFMGIFSGFLLGFIRYILFSFMEGRQDFDFGKGVKIT